MTLNTDPRGSVPYNEKQTLSLVFSHEGDTLFLIRDLPGFRCLSYLTVMLIPTGGLYAGGKYIFEVMACYFHLSFVSLSH